MVQHCFITTVLVALNARAAKNKEAATCRDDLASFEIRSGVEDCFSMESNVTQFSGISSC